MTDRTTEEALTPEVLSDLLELHKRTSEGVWGQGQTSHNTVAKREGQPDYRIADFHHADDASFVDAAHKYMPMLIAALQWQAEQQKGEADAWQGRAKSMDPADADDPWGSWREVRLSELEAWRRRVARDPEHYELRPLFAASSHGVPPVEQVPAILFDGYAVLKALDKKAAARTSAENVSDVLDAVVRLLSSLPQAPQRPEWTSHYAQHIRSISEPFTLDELREKIDSNEYSAELLLQHAMRLLDGPQAPQGEQQRDCDTCRHQFLDGRIGCARENCHGRIDWEPIPPLHLLHKETAMNKAEYVKSQGQTRSHHCHWPGCEKQVPPAMWGCSGHWFKLPANLRAKIWATFRPGQEVKGTPSPAYVEAAKEVQQWIKDQQP